jgi:FkbM family methyltransferase
MAFLLHLLRSDDLFIDVGANVGSYSVLASAVCGAYAIAVEPDPDSMRSLQRNIEANGIGHRVTCVEAALGGRPGTARFTTGLDTTNRMACEGDTETREIRVKTLDEIARGQHPVLIKLDVEGHEAMVLEGGCDTLRDPSLLAVQVETAGEAVRDHLESAGFRRSAYAPFARKLSLQRDQRAVTGSPNSLFVRDLDACRRRVATATARNVLGRRI